MKGKGSPDRDVSDLVVRSVYFQCCFGVVWVPLRDFPFNSNVDESTHGVCGLPSYFSPCSGQPLVLALKITWALHR